MGWMRTILLGDVGNRLDIEDAENDIQKLSRKYRNTSRALDNKERQINALGDEIARQKLAIQALTRFVIEKGLVDEKEFDEFISQVDAEDGVLDGKMTLDFSTKRLRFREGTIADGTFKKRGNV